MQELSIKIVLQLLAMWTFVVQATPAINPKDLRQLKSIQVKNIKKASQQAAYLFTHPKELQAFHTKKNFAKNGVRVEKRSLIQRHLQAYIERTWGKDTIETANYTMLLDETEKARHQFLIRKRQVANGTTEEIDNQLRKEAQAQAQVIAAKFEEHLRTHQKTDMDSFLATHKKMAEERRLKTASGVTREKRQLMDGPMEEEDFFDAQAFGTDTGLGNLPEFEDFDLEDYYDESQALAPVMSKRALLKKDPKNQAIWGILFGFLLIPFLVAGFSFGIGGILASILWTIVFITPVTNKIIFGTWW